MANINESLQFNGTWRSYQARVLERSSLYLQDKKIHIVAAPGSGKTTLGIELIKRTGKPCLILSPGIVIREQWLSRIEEAFLTENVSSVSLLSSDIRKPSSITAITYQALHCAMTKNKGTEETTDFEEETEETAEKKDAFFDYSDFDILKTVKDMGIGTICLDECHHLRNEWWKALGEFIKELPDITIISLTATPPYDSTPAQWDRYISLCGPIDEEIIVPELVREGSLCPHQDYVYFSYPTAEEKDNLRQFKYSVKNAVDILMADETFAKLVSSHAGFKNYDAYEEKFLDNPAYLSALLIFMNQKHIPVSPKYLKLLGAKNLPHMTERWMELLLNGFLYEDKESFPENEEYREELIKYLKRQKLIIRNKVVLTANEAINKMMTNSKGKIKSISHIIRSEHDSLGAKLRLLILTDYIKKDYRSAVGNPEDDVFCLGVIPLFETIRRENMAELTLGILCGSLIVIPTDAIPRLETLAAEYEELQNKISYKEITDRKGMPLNYSEVVIAGKKHISTALITRLFEEGYMHVLVGTKSLLGEGWDSPCINSLILASFVGSFVLSNQMRGRAIRVMKNNPDKTSNIWHLVCMTPESIEIGELSQDFVTLQRRMKGFLGLSYTGNTIENGLERLDIITPPYTQEHICQINEQMCLMSRERESLKKRWEDALLQINKTEVADECQTAREKLAPTALLTGIWAKGIMSLLIFLLFGSSIIRAVLKNGLFSFSAIFTAILAFLCFSSVLKFTLKIFRLFTPQRRMESVGRAVLHTLQQTDNITSKNVRVCAEEEKDGSLLAYLKGGTTREKDLFAECLQQFFAPVDNQRYLLYHPNTSNSMMRFFCVPDIFAKSKESSSLFTEAAAKCIGNYKLIYTRNPEGRKILLKARTEAFANRSMRFSERRKKVKNALE